MVKNGSDWDNKTGNALWPMDWWWRYIGWWFWMVRYIVANKNLRPASGIKKYYWWKLKMTQKKICFMIKEKPKITVVCGTYEKPFETTDIVKAIKHAKRYGEYAVYK